MFRAGRRTIFCGVNEVFEGLNDTPERRGLTRSAISSSSSRIFMKTVTHLLGGGDISFKEAGMLLNISPMKVGKYVS